MYNFIHGKLNFWLICCKQSINKCRLERMIELQRRLLFCCRTWKRNPLIRRTRMWRERERCLLHRGVLGVNRGRKLKNLIQKRLSKRNLNLKKKLWNQNWAGLRTEEHPCVQEKSAITCFPLKSKFVASSLFGCSLTKWMPILVLFIEFWSWILHPRGSVIKFISFQLGIWCVSKLYGIILLLIVAKWSMLTGSFIRVDVLHVLKWSWKTRTSSKVVSVFPRISLVY